VSNDEIVYARSTRIYRRPLAGGDETLLVDSAAVPDGFTGGSRTVAVAGAVHAEIETIRRYSSICGYVITEFTDMDKGLQKIASGQAAS